MRITKEQLRILLMQAYRLGWEASGEGYNAEYPGEEILSRPPNVDHWLAHRELVLKDLLEPS